MQGYSLEFPGESSLQEFRVFKRGVDVTLCQKPASHISDRRQGGLLSPFFPVIPKGREAKSAPEGACDAVAFATGGMRGTLAVRT